MAGLGSNRDLWHFITGSYLRRPPDLIKEELKKNKDKLVKGITFYEKPKKGGVSKLQKERKIKDVQLDFVRKLSTFLQLDEVQSHDIFRLYLLHDYRGSQKELQRLLSVDRHAQALILKVRDYYFSERLCLLRCLKHLFSYWQETKHPYKEQYASFVEEVCDNEGFAAQVVSQYTELCDELAPTWEVHGNAMNERQASVWVIQNLREQCELLEIMVLFYKEYMHPATAYGSLAAIFKKQGFGRRQTNKHLLDESADPLLNRIGYLQVVLLLEGVDLEFLLKCHENNGLSEHHINKNPKIFKTIDGILSSLGDIVQHGPILLMWAVFRQMTLQAEGGVITRRLGNQALSLRTFDFLRALLSSEPFNGKTMLASVCQYVIYSMLCTVLSIFHEDTLGDTQALYAVAATLLKQPNISEDFWQRGLTDGLGVLLHSAQQRFPLEFLPLLQLSASLASSSKASAQKVVEVLREQPVYMEYFDRNRARDIQSTENDDVWQLSVAKRPYNSDMLIIPRGCYGLLIPQPGKGGQIIQWEFSYDAIAVFTAETSTLLLQVAQGATTVTPDGVDKVTEVARVVHALVTADPALADMFSHIIDMMCPIIQRFCLLSPPPLPLLAAAIDTIGCVATRHAKKSVRMGCHGSVWHGLQQTGLLPYLTENLDSLAEYTSGAGLSAGAYGSILAGYECNQGHYAVTIALLRLTEALVQPLHTAGSLESLTAVLLFVCREIFPVFGKWRYYEPTGREQVGQLCLRIFHRILNILNNDKAKKAGQVSLRDLCVYSLLFTESGRAVLDIISTGVDTVEVALSNQGSVQEGAGMELIQLIKLAFSVLNRLLLLRPADSPPSPVEHALSTQPANRAHRHVVATIAQYVYHRHDMRLPTLATLLLKRLAMVFPMSILACLGNEAEAIRDMYLTRLAARTEDVRLKVVILELLAVCVETQPGLTEMYLNVQPAPLSSSSTTSSSNVKPSSSSAAVSTPTDTTETKDKKDLSVGRTSCLITLLDLIEEQKQGTYQCPSDLLCAALQFLHALWYGRRETAMAVLREKPTYWRSVCLSLMRDLPEPTETMKEASFNVLEKEVKTCAHILRILAQELYAVNSDKLDGNLKNVIKDIVSKERLQYWSTYLREKLKVSGVAGHEPDEELDDDGTLHLLLAWRSLVLVLAVHKPSCFTLGDNVKNQILKDILDGLQAQFSNGLNQLNIKLASISSALYFTVLKHWKGTIREWHPLLEQLLQVLTQTCANSETLVPSIQIGLLGALNVALQHLRVSILKDVDAAVLRPLVPVVCGVLQQSTYQLYPPSKKEAVQNDNDSAAVLDVKLKLQVITVVLLEELVVAMDRTEEWLPAVTEHSILQGLLGSVQTWIEARHGRHYISAVLQLFITMSNIPQAAELLALNGLTHHLCLAVSNLHAVDSAQRPAATPKQLGSEGSSDVMSWSDVYRRYLTLNTCMLNTLRYTFLQDALSFVGVHQDRMLKTIENIRLDLSSTALAEVEDTCHFLSRLAVYRREWRLHLPDVLNRLMTQLCYLCHTCVSMLIRPLVLQHVLEKKSGTDRSKQLGPEKLTMTPVTKRLSSQTSIDDTDLSNQQVLQTQYSLLRILAECLATMRQFSPDLCGILLDQSLDVAEYDPLLQIAFSTPSMDMDSAPTFGTMISTTNMCLRLLTKLDPKSTSPNKSPKGETPIKRSVIQYVMENALWLVMSQAGRYLREPNLAPRDKQLLKRELSAELNSFLICIQRHFRRAPTSPANSTLLSPGGSNKTLMFSSTQEQAYFELVDSFVKNVLR